MVRRARPILLFMRATQYRSNASAVPTKSSSALAEFTNIAKSEYPESAGTTRSIGSVASLAIGVNGMFLRSSSIARIWEVFATRSV